MLRAIKFMLVGIFTLLFFTEYAFPKEFFDELLNEAYMEAEEETLDDVFDLAIRSFNDGVYSIAIEKGEKFLKEYYKNDYKREAIVHMLAIIYYKNKDYKNLKRIFFENEQNLSRDTKLKIFQLINNYLVRKKRFKEVKKLRRKYLSFFLKSPPFEIINPKLKAFKPNRNIFQLKDEIYIGENSLYIATRNTTLVQIAKELDMGYDEVRYANPEVNPFDVTRGMAVFVPRKRLLPDVAFEVGTIYLNLGEKRLYYPIKDDNDKILVITIPVGIGTDDNQSPIGVFKISEKRKDPKWYVPESIKKENPDLPDVFPPGPDNPLGTRAMRLGTTSFLMHGTSKRYGIGMRVSHGCIRMYNRDVEKLFEVVKVGTKVVITEQKYKMFIRGDTLNIEIHELTKKDKQEILKNLTDKGFNVDENLILFLGKENRAYMVQIERQ